jgi:hypothetical protein
METKGSLLHSKELTTGLYLEPDESSAYPPTLFPQQLATSPKP